MRNGKPLGLSEEARKARNKYSREYYQKNKERIRAQRIKYWEKVAATQKESEEEK